MPSNAEDYRQTLLSVGAWRELPLLLRHAVVEILLTVGEVRSIPKKGIWLKEASLTKNKGYVLLEGRALVRRDEHGQLEVTSPSLIGEMMQFNPAGLRTATVSSITSCFVLKFSWEDFWQKVAERLDDQDSEAVRNSIVRHSWIRFAEFPD